MSDLFGMQLEAKAASEAARAAQRAIAEVQDPSTLGGNITVDGVKRRPIHLRTVYKADIRNAALALHNFRDNERIREVLQSVCNEAVRADHGLVIPGVDT